MRTRLALLGAVPAFLVLAAPALARDITLEGPGATTAGHRVTFSGRVTPAVEGLRVGVYLGSSRVAETRTTARGAFVARAKLFTTGPYRARAAGAVSAPHRVEVRGAEHGLALAGPGSAPYGAEATFTGRLTPAKAGVDVGIYLGSSRVGAATTGRDGRFRVRVRLFSPGGYRARARGLVSAPVRVEVAERPLAPGATGDGVQRLLGRLAALGYAVADRAATEYDGAVEQAVYAFQKAQGLPVDGVAGPATLARLADPLPVRPRFTTPADHIEVDKKRQLLLLVRGGRVVLVVNTSTAGIPGYSTPSGRFRVFRRVAGWDPSPLGQLYDPLYFYGGYAIHGSTSVPPTPASHGCVRVPIWQAARFFDTIPNGELVILY